MASLEIGGFKEMVGIIKIPIFNIRAMFKKFKWTGNVENLPKSECVSILS